MTFEEYQKKAQKTAIYPNRGKNFSYPVLGLCGESGEVAEKFKKIIRDKKGEISNQDKEEIKKELGDVLWYLSEISYVLGISLDDIAKFNIEKLYSRMDRNKINGNGDNR